MADLSVDEVHRVRCIRLGVVADDLTGSTDIGIMFSKAGYAVDIFTFDSQDAKLVDEIARSTAEVVILNTNARLFGREEAYQAAFRASQILRQAGCRQFYNKTCSVFRGPVGAFFDGMLDALGMEFGLVVLGFPKNGRTTVNGIHYVHGKLLEQSEFRTDPIHPMRQSNLVEILLRQTDRKVGWLAVTDQTTPESLAAEIEAARLQSNYLFLDVPNQQALRTIAEAAAGETILCGSSGLAEELPAAWGVEPSRQSDVRLPSNQSKGILVASGSLMPQTRAQLDWLNECGVEMVEFEQEAIIDPDLQKTEISKISAQLTGWIREGKDAAFSMPNQPEIVRAVQGRALERGYQAAEIGKIISDTIAEVVSRVVEQTGLTRMVVAGGETSAAVCARLGMGCFRVWEEIEPGLPSCLALDGKAMLLVLKSGSFGSPDFLQKALDHLRIEAGE